MAGSFNRVFLMGNLTRDPEVKYTATNMAICKIGLAATRKFLANGEKREETLFIDCDAFGKTGENIGKFFTKGRPIFIEGHLRLDQWEKDGQKHSKIKVVVDNFQFVDSNPNRGSGGEQGGEEGGAPARVQTRTGRAPTPAAPATEIQEEDIPF